MAIIITLVEGVTTPQRFQLLEDGAAINLSGLTVALLLKDRFGTTVSTSGMVTVTDSASGKVDLTPSSGALFDVTKSPYYARWTLTDTQGSISYVPSGLRDTWHIVTA